MVKKQKKAGKFKEFGKGLGKSFDSMGDAMEKVMKNLEETDKKMNEIIKKATAGIE